MGTVGIGIGENTNFTVAQVSQVIGRRFDADRDRYIVHFLRRQHLVRGHFPGIQNLAA